MEKRVSGYRRNFTFASTQGNPERFEIIRIERYSMLDIFETRPISS